MTDLNKKFGTQFFILLFFSIATMGWSQNLQLKVVGDTEKGYNVNIYNGNQILLENTEEFSIHMANLDLSENITISAWKGKKWSGDAKKLTLSRDTYVSELDLNLSIHVSYEIVNKNVIKKSIDLFKSGMPSLYYSIEETAKPAVAPLKYLTFEHDNFPGGFVHEMFPSAGFVSPENLVVGFLMDAGYKNQYTRTTRRRFNGHGGGFVGMRILPDPALVSVATAAEQANGQNYIKQSFGEMYNLDAGKELNLKITDDFQKVGAVNIEKKDGVTTLNYNSSEQSGIEFISPLRDQKAYTISFLSKGTAPIALKLFRVKNGQKTVELENGVKYIDRFPPKENEWTLFKGSVLVPYIENDSVSLFIGAQSGDHCTLQIKELQIVEHEPKKQAYNKLYMGEKATKTTYVFVEPWKNHHDFVVSSQTRLAEGKGFKGSEIEKMLYSNFNMLTWITSVNDFTPFNVPNMNYAPDMYNRDSFFSIVSSYNKELNLSIWEKWGNTQTTEGGIGTIITPYMGSVEVKDNEATIHWLIWAMMNKRRFGITSPKKKLTRQSTMF
jgi:hypothetical protein